LHSSKPRDIPTVLVRAKKSSLFALVKTERFSHGFGKGEKNSLFALLKTERFSHGFDEGTKKIKKKL